MGRGLALSLVAALAFAAIWLLMRRRDSGAVWRECELANRAFLLELERRKLERERAEAREDPPILRELRALSHKFERWAAAASSTHDPHEWHLLLDAGDVYARGSYPQFRPDRDVALRLYKTALMCPDAEVAGWGQAKFQEAYAEPMAREDIAGDELPSSYGQHMVDVATRKIMCTPMHSFSKPRWVGRVDRHGPPPQLPDPVHGPAPGPAPGLAPGPAPGPTRGPTPTIELMLPAIDTQNVHDHGVMSSLRQNVSRLRTSAGGQVPGEDETLIREVEDAVHASDISVEDKARASDVLRSLAVDRHSQLGLSEQGALRLVWDRILGLAPDVRANAVGTLGQQLSSAKERGFTVCSTGKMARILGALDGVDGEGPVARPMWAVNEELLTLAAKTREDVLGDATIAERESYERGTSTVLETRMTETFVDRARREYVDAQGMSAAVLRPLLDAAAAGF